MTRFMPFFLAAACVSVTLTATSAAPTSSLHAANTPDCDAPICLIDADTLTLARIVTFDDQPSSFGVGRQIETVLQQPGVSLASVS